MLYAYFGGQGADRRTTYELVLEQHGSAFALTSTMAPRGHSDDPPSLAARLRWLRPPLGAAERRRLYAGADARRALLIMLQAACGANLAELGQRFCYVLPSVPSQPGALASLVPPQLRYDGSLPLHPQLWQAGRPLETLPAERHAEARAAAPAAEGWADRRGRRVA